MKPGKRRRHSQSSSKAKTSKFSLLTLEQFLLNYGLGIAGAIIFILGLLFLIINHFGNDNVLSLIQSFLKPGPEEAFNPIKRNFPVALIFRLSFLYLPCFIPLIAIFFLPSGRAILKNSLILAGFLWLTLAEGKLFLYNAYFNGIFFTGFYPALIYFSIIQIILIFISAFNKSRFALNLSVIFFFISIALIRSYFGGLLPFFLLLMFLQFSILFLSVKFRWRSPLVLTVLLSGCYLIFYILRKIIFAENEQPVSYMLPSLSVWFFISVTGLAILKSTSYRKTISTLWDSISYISPVLVVGLIAFVNYSFGQNYLICQCSAMVIITLIIVAVLNEKYYFLKSRRAFYFSICFFGASLVPQLMASNFLLIFAASLAVTLLIHFHLTSSRVSFNLAKVLFYIMVSLYLLEWGLNIMHALNDQRTSGDIYPFNMVLLCMLVASISLFYIRLSSFIISEHPSLQTPALIPANFEEICFTFIAYSSGFLVLDYLLISIFRGYRLNLIELAMFTYAFLWLIFPRKLSGPRTIVIIRTVISFLVIALYPAIVQPEVILYRNLFLEGNSPALIPFILHFFTLGLMILLLLQANSYLLKLFNGRSEIRHYIKLISVILITFILLSEYDHLSLFWFSHNSELPAADILRSNKFIPYSALLLLISISGLIYSLIRYSRFLRRVSLIMIILVIFKIFIFDLKILTGNAIVILLITVGLVLLGLSLIIRRIRKHRKSLHPGTSSGVNTIC